MNQKLTDMSLKLHFHVIDNSDSVQDPNLRYDGLHLTEKSTTLLVRNFKNAYLSGDTRGSTAFQRTGMMRHQSSNQLFNNTEPLEPIQSGQPV